MNALVSARDKRVLYTPVKPARTAPLAPWLAFAVNVVSKSGADADLQHRPSQCWPDCRHQPDDHTSPGSCRQVRRPRRGLERGRGIEICAHVRKKIWAYGLFACSAAGPALQKHQKSRCSIAPSAWRGNQPCAALGTRIGAPYSITCWHVRYPRNQTYGPKRVAWHGARGCELAHIQAIESHGGPYRVSNFCTNLLPPVT
jgi:hypothetical protein